MSEQPEGPETTDEDGVPDVLEDDAAEQEDDQDAEGEYVDGNGSETEAEGEVETGEDVTG